MLENCARLEKRINEKVLIGEEHTPYHVLFAEADRKTWNHTLKLVLKYFAHLQEYDKLVEECEWKLQRAQRKFKQIPFNCANPNLAQARLDYSSEIIELEALRGKLGGARGYIIDFMQRLNNAVHGVNPSSQTLRETLDRVFCTHPRLSQCFKEWLNNDITRSDTDFPTLIRNSHATNMEFNDAGKNAHSAGRF